MIFQDRTDAGRRLASQLGRYANRDDVTVLGIPRGGVVVAFEVASALGDELDIFLSRKLGVPGQEELAFGAVATGGVRVLDRPAIEALEISAEQIERIADQAQEELERREHLYRGARSTLQLKGRTVILVDDGIATGSSMHAAIEALGKLEPARIVVAVPVAPLSASYELKAEVDEMVCVYTPESFYAIGQFYEDFSQVADEEVADLIRRAQQRMSQKSEHSHQGAEKGAR